jgi:putative iron-regulated protein
MYAFPLSIDGTNAILADTSIKLTSDYFYPQAGSVKGMHAVEYLIWGIDGKKTYLNITKREREYISACDENISSELSKLYDNWRCGNGFGCFINNILEAGVIGIYSSQNQCLVEFVNNSIRTLDELANWKLKDPSIPIQSYSDNIKEDALANIHSVESIYFGINKNGNNEGNNMGLSTIVVGQDPSMDTQVRIQIQKTIDAIEDIPISFNTAYTSNPQTISLAVDELNLLLQIYQNEIHPTIKKLQ